MRVCVCACVYMLCVCVPLLSLILLLLMLFRTFLLFSYHVSPYYKSHNSLSVKSQVPQLQLAKSMPLQAVRVTKAWDEDYDGHVADMSSLHPGGRALLVKLVSGDTSKLPALSQLAICAKADFVQHDGEMMIVSNISDAPNFTLHDLGAYINMADNSTKARSIDRYTVIPNHDIIL